jgi:hypothetical protein
MVTPPGQLAAGNIKLKLFPPPVPITTTMGLLFIMIAWIASRWIPRNAA